MHYNFIFKLPKQVAKFEKQSRLESDNWQLQLNTLIRRRPCEHRSVTDLIDAVSLHIGNSLPGNGLYSK